MATNQNRHGVSSWLVRWLSRLLVLVLAFVAGAVVMHVGMHAGDHDHIQALQAQNTQLQDQLTQSQAALAASKSQTGVQDGTQRALQDKITELQQTLGTARDQLSFYEQLLPAGPAGAIAIRAFNVEPEGDFLHYRVLLTRSTPEQVAPFKGRLRFVATGLQNGKAVKIDLLPPRVSDASAGAGTAVEAGAPPVAVDPLALAFDQYQRSTGVLQRVPGLTIQSVRVDVLEGDTVRASQNVVLAEASNGAAGSGATQ